MAMSGGITEPESSTSSELFTIVKFLNFFSSFKCFVVTL